MNITTVTITRANTSSYHDLATVCFKTVQPFYRTSCKTVLLKAVQLFTTIPTAVKPVATTITTAVKI
jgi:hypothetical protein